MNSNDIFGDPSFVDWGNDFWSDWLFPIGTMAEEPAPPYHLVSSPEMVGIQGFAPSSSNNVVADVWQPKVSIKETIMQSYLFHILPLQ